MGPLLKCLLLDILIDCEEYKKFDDEFDDVLRSLKEISQEVDGDLKKQQGIIETIEQKISGLDEIDSDVDVNCFKIIATSKYIRRLIKEEERTLETKRVKILFKTLTEKLLKKIPESITTPEEYNRDNQFRIIFLNEISACSESDLAIGYADMALNELKELNNKWHLKKPEEERIRHPYELYALYNQGLTYLHNHRDADKAIEKLSQITPLFERPKKKTKLFEKEYEKFDELFPICFWFFYLPSKYLIAEAYGDSFSSFNLEDTVNDALKTITKKVKQGKVGISNASGGELTPILEKYSRTKLGIQLIFSAIDKRDKKVFDKSDIKECDPKWLEKFGTNDEMKKIVNALKDAPDHPSIKTQLDSAKALFLLEYMRQSEVQSKNYLRESFNICTKHLKQDCGTDWSDFACTFLECAIFELEKENFQLLSEVEFDKYYKHIFKRLNNEKDWFARKKELVENVLLCQEKLLEHRKINKEKRDEYITYQIALIKNILSEDSERRFQKRWSNSQKEKLGKSLKITVSSHKKKDLLEWWNGAKNALKEKNGDGWANDFQPIIESLNEELNHLKYSLPEDVRSVAKFVNDHMNCDYYTKKLRMNTEEFNDHLIYQSCRSTLTNCYALTVLRRWQSFTPALSMGSEVGHKGGGYFVYKTNHKGEITEGLVVDPGFDFLDNFFDEGFSIRDISGILITHSHSDHANDFMAIVTLVHEMNENGNRVFKGGKWKDRKLILFIAEGCHQNFAMRIMRNKDKFHDVIRVNPDTQPYGGKNHFLEEFQLEVTKANHEDQSDHDSVGYIIKDRKGKELIGFTGDTRWYNTIEDNYKKCPVICMNIGGVIDIFKEPKLKLSDLCDKDNDEQLNNIKKILLREKGKGNRSF